MSQDSVPANHKQFWRERRAEAESIYELNKLCLNQADSNRGPPALVPASVTPYPLGPTGSQS